MRIGIFTDTFYPEINGVANSAYQLKLELEKLGHSVYVFTVTNKNVHEAEHNVFRIQSLPCVLVKERRIAVSLFNRWMKKIDILNLDMIHTQTEFFLGMLGRKASEKYMIPLVHTYHTIYEDYTHYLRVPKRYSGIAKNMIKNYSRTCCNMADQIIVPTNKTKKLLESYGVYKKINIQPTGINLRKFETFDEESVTTLKNKYNIKKEDTVLSYIGRLSKEKNVSELIQYLLPVLKNNSNIKLLIVGEGPEIETLMNSAKMNDIENSIIFTGPVPWDDIQNYYRVSDIFISASKSETQGLTYLEAMATGRPVLARQDECLDGFLKEGINGFSYSNQEEFLTNLQTMITDDVYIKQGIQAKITAKTYEISYFAKMILGIYKDTINNVSRGYGERHNWLAS